MVLWSLSGEDASDDLTLRGGFRIPRGEIELLAEATSNTDTDPSLLHRTGEVDSSSSTIAAISVVGKSARTSSIRR